MIVGIGVDIVDVARFEQSLARTPSMKSRLFTERECVDHKGIALTPVRLAARFAVKEALAKALGAPGDLAWHDCEVLTDDSGAPLIVASGTVEQACMFRDVTRWHVSMSHDAGMAIAYVIAEKGEDDDSSVA